MGFQRETSESSALRRPSDQVATTGPAFSSPRSPVVLRPELLTPWSLLVLQQQAGNSAVTSLLKPVRPLERTSVERSAQRCPDRCAPEICGEHEDRGSDFG